MKLKTIFFGLLVIQLVFYVIWLFGYLDIFSMDELNRQTYTLMANIKALLVVAFYIAWRVTPENK